VTCTTPCRLLTARVLCRKGRKIGGLLYYLIKWICVWKQRDVYPDSGCVMCDERSWRGSVWENARVFALDVVFMRGYWFLIAHDFLRLTTCRVCGFQGVVCV
jgi:hypothetical protein